jgi:hypothetical protein
LAASIPVWTARAAIPRVIKPAARLAVITVPLAMLFRVAAPVPVATTETPPPMLVIELTPATTLANVTQVVAAPKVAPSTVCVNARSAPATPPAQNTEALVASAPNRASERRTMTQGVTPEPRSVTVQIPLSVGDALSSFTRMSIPSVTAVPSMLGIAPFASAVMVFPPPVIVLAGSAAVVHRSTYCFQLRPLTRAWTWPSVARSVAATASSAAIFARVAFVESRTSSWSVAVERI